MRLSDAGELRAAASWQHSRRLYLAHSQKEAVWIVDLSATKPGVTRLAQNGLRDVAGVALIGNSLCLADEGFGLSLDAAFKAHVPSPPATASGR